MENIMGYKIIRSEMGGETTKSVIMKGENSSVIMNLPTTVILFKKTLFKDMFKIPKVLVSIILMVFVHLMAILDIPKGIEFY